MNIGIFFKHKPSGGGIYQYFLSFMDCIRKWNSQDRFFVFCCHNLDVIDEYLNDGINVIVFSNTDNKNDDHGYKAIHNGKEVYFKSKPFSEELKLASEKYQIDLMLYTNIERESFESGKPFITALHDWTHKTHPQFKEFTADGVYEQREYVILNAIKVSDFILADSETGKKEIIEYYGTDSSKLITLPFVPPPYITKEISENKLKEIKSKYDLPEKFIFYPAQFWPHKNHENIIRALYYLKNDFDLQISAIFVGSTVNKWSNIEDLTILAKSLNIENQIRHLGYINSEDVGPIYRLATALVMPTFPGPTNIPVLEAFATSCPVITSDIKALREQVGDAGLLVNPNSHEEIGMAIKKIWTDDSFKHFLIKKGFERIAAWTHNDFCIKLYGILDAWKSNIKKEN